MRLSYRRSQKDMVLRSIALPTTPNSASQHIQRTFTQPNMLLLTACLISNNGGWSSSHRLKLNAAKSEVIWLGTRQQLTRLSQAAIILGLNNIVLDWPAHSKSHTGVHGWS